MKVKVRLFGAFRDLGADPLVEVELPQDAVVADLRDALHRRWSAEQAGFNPGLLRCSAFADETQVLREREPLADGATVAILPPVSGG